MTASATAPTTENAERARENREYVRSLLKARQPQFAAALESTVGKLLRDHQQSACRHKGVASPAGGCSPCLPAPCTACWPATRR